MREQSPSGRHIIVVGFGALVVGLLGIYALVGNDPPPRSNPQPCILAEPKGGQSGGGVAQPEHSRYPGRVYKISGHVRDAATGNGLSGVTISARWLPTTDLDEAVKRIGSKADPSGGFEVSVPQELCDMGGNSERQREEWEPLQLVFESDGYARVEATIPHLWITKEQELQVNLRRAVRISGSVRSEGGERLQGAYLSWSRCDVRSVNSAIRPAHARMQATPLPPFIVPEPRSDVRVGSEGDLGLQTSVSGEYEILTSDNGSGFLVAVEDPKWGDAQSPCLGHQVLSLGGAQDIRGPIEYRYDFVMERGTPFVVSLKDPGGSNVVDAMVWVTEAEGEKRTSTRMTDKDGNAYFRVKSPQVARISVSGSGGTKDSKGGYRTYHFRAIKLDNLNVKEDETIALIAHPE